MPSFTEFNANAYISRYPDLQYKYVCYSKDGTRWVSSNVSIEHARAMLRAIRFKLGITNILDMAGNNYLMPQDAYKHYQDFGQKEGRAGGVDMPGTIYSNLFNGAAYLARYPDVSHGYSTSYPGILNTFENDPYDHYLKIGKSQNRIPGYEILNESSPGGFSTPGTTKFVSVESGLGINTPEPVTANTTQGDNVDTSKLGVDSGTTAQKNIITLLIVGVAAYLLLRK